VTELEILRRRRELVLLSAQLQRATVVRRLDNLSRHPLQLVFAAASSVASLVSLPLMWKAGSMLIGAVRRRQQPVAVRKASSKLRNLLRSALRLVTVLKAFPVLKFFNR
jgi:hypothetical protein